MLKLVGTDGARLYSFELEAGVFDIGRSKERAIYIPDVTVSRVHAEIVVEDDGSCYLTDKESYNGTTLNDVRVTDRVKIQVGDKVGFGQTEFRIKDDSSTDSSMSRRTATILAESEPEKSVMLPLDEVLKPLPSKVTDLPELFPTLSEMARMLVLPEPQEVMLERSLGLVNRMIQADRLAVLLKPEDSDELYTAAVLLPGGKDPGEFNLSRTIVNDILTNKNALVVGDPMSDPRFAEQQSIIRSALKSAMAAPLMDEDTVLGILYVDTTNPLHRYNDDYLRLLATFANIIGSRLMNYELLAERQEKQVYEAELMRAATIQKSLLAIDYPAIDGYAIHAFQEPCRAVGGDLYDVAALPDGRLVFLVGDVSGKGMGAALLMSNILASLRILYNSREFSMSQCVEMVSSQLFRVSTFSDFATLFVGIIDPRKHSLTYINAGHNPPILVRKDGSHEHLEPCGTMIGAFEAVTWEEAVVTMGTEDQVLVFTDGVTEAEHESDMYSEERLEALVLKSHDQTPEELVQTILADVKDYVQDSPRSDDITMLAVKRII